MNIATTETTMGWRTPVVPYEERSTRHFLAGRPVLDEWTRWSYASLAEEQWWAHLMQRAGAAWQQIEMLSVVDGVRAAARISVAADQLAERTLWALERGLVLQPIGRTDASTSSCTKAPEPGKAWNYHAILTRPEHVRDVHRLTRDDAALGELLGYPACCRQAFMDTWAKGQVDGNYDQFMGAGTADGPTEANLLWRLLGVRAVPHLPCSFTCSETASFGQRLRAVARAHGFHEEALLTDEVLQWPVKWSAVNGIAEIVGPCVKISTRTDWHPELRMFSRAGVYVKPDAALWKNNGFKTADGMLRVHDRLLAALKEHVPSEARVLDLGCGNGLLLRRLKRLRPDVRIAGVDSNDERLAGARTALVGTWTCAPIQQLSWEGTADVALVSVAHLLDMDNADCAKVVEKLPKRVVPYAYGDCVQKHGPLTTMCAKAGLPVPAILDATSDVQLGLIQETKA